MKINRFFTLAVIALLVVGATGAISANAFAKGNTAPATQSTVQVQDCSQDQADDAEAQDVADMDNVDLQCGDQNAQDDQTVAADADTDTTEVQEGDQNAADTAKVQGAEEAESAGGQDEATTRTPAITVDQAQQAALAANPGVTVIKTELDNENGSLVYSVEMSNGTDVKVDAGNGSIIFTDSGADNE